MRSYLTSLLAVACAVSVASGQVLNTDLITSNPEWPVLRTTVYDPFCDQQSCDQDLESDQVLERLEPELSRYKKQALQSFAISAGSLADVGDTNFNNHHVDVSIGSGIPLGSFDNILGVTPRFRLDWIDAGASFDVPDELYQFELQFFYRRPISDRLSLIAIISPSLRSDLTTGEDAMRIFALGLLNWEYIRERLTLSGGAVFLDRADLPVLPAMGLMWTPNRFTRLDLRFPTSKFSRRLAKDGSRSEHWAYLSGGLGGNTWAITRSSGETDEISLRDLRLTLGFEKVVDGGGGWFAESGYALSRRIEFERSEEQIDLDNAAFIQAGWRY